MSSDVNICQLCNVPFATPSSLKRHISARHSSEIDGRGQTRTRHQCPHCHAHFARGETVRRHIRSKHEGGLSTCSFCSKQFRADYMPQHKPTCARKYWRKIEQYANPSDGAGVTHGKSRLCSPRSNSPNDVEEGNLRFRGGKLPEVPDMNHTLRIVHENTIDARLAADALSQVLLWYEEAEDVERYKAALVTALCLNITVSLLDRTFERVDCFHQLDLIAICFDKISRGVKQINDLDDNLGTTILHAACRTGFAELLEPLYWRGSCFNLIDGSHETPLESAISSDDIDTIHYALALGSDPNLHFPLFDALDNEEHHIITLLLKHGADINQRYEFGENTLLSEAIENSDWEKACLTLSYGADPNIADPMEHLIENCLVQGCDDNCIHQEMACLLIEHGLDATKQYRDGSTVFHYAAMRANAKLLRMALDQISSPAILDVEDDYHYTALRYVTAALSHVTAAHGAVPLDGILASTSMLLEAGADINAQDEEGVSALMRTARNGNADVVRLLLDAGAIVTTIAEDCQSALSIAARYGHAPIVRHLLEAAPPPHEDSLYLNLALKEAVSGNNADIVQDLLSSGADAHSQDALSFAIRRSSAAIVQLLLKAGAEPDNVQRHMMVELFKARDAESRGNYIHPWCDASAKCELLVRKT